MGSGLYVGRSVQELPVFQVTNTAATFPVLNGELLLLKGILEIQNLSGCLGVAAVGASVGIKGVTNCIKFTACVCLDAHRYLQSIVETILIYQHFKKLTPEQHTAKQELVDFWMDFLVEATKTDVSVVRFPVSGWLGGMECCGFK